MVLSDQALSCIMVALQKSLMEQSDIVPVLKGFKLDVVEGGGELVVTNPPKTLTMADAVTTGESQE